MNKVKAFLMIIVIAILTTIGCTGDNNIEPQRDLIWGFYWDHWEYSYLKSIDLNNGNEVDIIKLDNINSGSKNLVFNEKYDEFIFTYNGILRSIDLHDHVIKEIMFVGDSVFELQLDNIEQVLYGFRTQNSKTDLIKIDLNNEKIEILYTDFTLKEIQYVSRSTLNLKNKKYYFSLNGFLYTFDIETQQFEDIVMQEIENISYNSMSNELYGICHSDGRFQLVKFDPDKKNALIEEFSERIIGFQFNSSAINISTGDYIFKGNGTELHLVDKNGNIKTINTNIETGFVYQRNE